MIWFVRIVVIVLFTICGPIFLPSREHQPLGIRDFVMGFGTGLFVIGLSLLIGKLGKKISARTPIGSRRVGAVFYWLGVVLAIWCAVLSVYVAYEGGPGKIVGMLASFAIAYWAAGWGLRRALTAN